MDPWLAPQCRSGPFSRAPGGVRGLSQERLAPVCGLHCTHVDAVERVERAGARALASHELLSRLDIQAVDPGIASAGRCVSFHRGGLLRTPHTETLLAADLPSAYVAHYEDSDLYRESGPIAVDEEETTDTSRRLR